MIYFLVVDEFLQILFMLRVHTSNSALAVMLVISPLLCKMSIELQKRRKKWLILKISQAALLWLQMQLLRLQDNPSMMILSSLIKLTIDLSKNVAYASTKI